MANYKRRKYLIKSAFQFKYIGLILCFILLTAILSGIVTYLAVFPYLSEKLANVYPQARLVTVLRDANIKVIIASFFIMPFAIWFGTVLSHKVAGPWFRLENIIRYISEGHLDYEVKLRKTDELQSLADAINALTRKLKVLSAQNISCSRSIDEMLSLLASELSKEPVDIMKVRLTVTKVQELSADLKNLINKSNLST